MNERLNRFISLLKQIFELDKSDLDFGIYRVMNLRKTQIEEFLTQRLPQMVQETLVPFAQGSKEEIRAQMTQIEESVAAMGMTVDVLPDTAPMKQKYVQLKKQLAEGADLSALETDVYSALYSFFNRYYEDGDFISKRRYKEGVYAIPYEGEEVKLYWANQDQYYIKTSENFKDYTFVFDGITVHFRLVDATTEQNNNKESKDSKRTFMLFTEDEENYPGIKTFEYDVEAREIVIRFVYDIPEDKKRKYAEENYDAIQKWILSLRDAEFIALLAPIPTGKGKETTTLLEKHLKGYVAKNTFDYFIHKDLRGFLTRELDFFIKSEVMHLEDLDSGSEARVETYLAKVKAIKRVGKIIIDFLAQIEDFQKKLWLKKKFVVETNWCITLDKIDESFWAEIIANKVQIDEWIDMYAIDEAEGWSNPPTVDFLRQNQNLIVDTKHFSNTFKYALLESIPNLDEQTDGLMINGDNYHALNFLQSRYSASIDVAYIDPPYNTDASEILYKNNYKHSSFLTMMDILVEMGEYFSRVTKPRMQKVAYAAEWKDGKPQNRTTGVPQIIKYMCLESYEDALSNIELSDDGGMMASLLGEDYLIHYMVDLESRGSLLDVEAFSNPFVYTMKITEKNECKERPVDLVETFNYLIGLTVTRQSTISYWLSKPAEHPAYEGAVELVSDISGQYVFRQIEGTLPDGRRALVIWRSVTDDIVASNAALDAYFTTYRNNAEDRKYDVIFVNGDSNLENLRGKSEGWTVRMTETEFKNRMFEEA